MPEKYHSTGNPLDLTTNPTFPKAVGLTDLANAGALTLHDRRLFDTLLAVAYDKIDQDIEHSVRMSDLRRLAQGEDAAMPTNTNARIKASVKRIKSLVVEFNYLGEAEGDWAIENLLGSVRYSSAKDTLYYTFPASLRPMLVDPALYARIRLAVVYEFRSKYALILYELLQRHADRRTPDWVWTIEIPRLRVLLGCEDRFPDYGQLSRRVLSPAVEEINLYAEFTVEIEPVRASNKKSGPGSGVTAVAFRVERKPAAIAAATARLHQKTQVEKKAVRKKAAAIGQLSGQAWLAYAWLCDQSPVVRQTWYARYVAQGGHPVPPPEVERERMKTWVPYIAEALCDEQGLR
ncbi:hypothetical protein [Azospirillum argentinense]|uniref:replication initiation protein n=1 Tax=Azospirillum argentinense TaxID=2970906 RepID=UPI0032DE6E05